MYIFYMKASISILLHSKIKPFVTYNKTTKATLGKMYTQVSLG